MAKVKNERPGPEKLQVIEDVGEELVRAFSERLFALEGLPTATVKYKDGNFKKKPLIAGWEYFLSYVYVGTKGLPIFGFTPEDDQDYEFVEFFITELDDFLPLLGPAIGEHYANGKEKATSAFNAEVDKRLLSLSVDQERAANKLNALPNFGRFA